MVRIVIILLLTISASIHQIVAQTDTVEVTISNTQPFIGEIITYSIFYASTDELSEARIELPEFVGFAQLPSNPTLTTETVNGLPHQVLRQEVSLHGTRTGTQTVESANIIIPETPFQSGVELASNAIVIDVRPLPDGAPDSFTGGVGQFDLNVDVELPIIQADEPNTLNISIVGTGNFDQIVSPPPPLPQTWQVFEGSPITDNANPQLQTKTFQYQFFAGETGEITIPSVIFTFFDPITASYKTITSQDITFTVEGEFPVSNQATSTIDNINQLPFKQMTDRPQSFVPPINFWIFWLIPPLIVLIMTLLQFLTRPRQKQDRQVRKQSHAFNIATQHLSELQKQSPNQIYSAIEQTIIQYISETYRQDVSDSAQIQPIIIDLPVNLQEKVLACIEQAKSGQYAPVTQSDAKTLLNRTYKTLQLIETERS